MTRDVGDIERDEELARLLARWSAPIVPDGMDERMLAAYRRQAGTAEPWWARLFTASVRLPLPVAVGLLMLFIVTAALALRPATPASQAGTTGPSAPVQAAQHLDPRTAVTRTSLAGFEPVPEVTATVLAETKETRQ
jgi:hypothetical protein